MQEAFIEHDAFQCGYCTPGQICSAVGLIAEGHARTPDEIREAMSGNICRCGAYPTSSTPCSTSSSRTPGSWRPPDDTGSTIPRRRVADAVSARPSTPARFIAGGTNLLDLMKYDVERPASWSTSRACRSTEIEDGPDGGLRIGALVRNTDVAYDPRGRQRYPLLSQAILAGASAQLRNAATTGGNLLQRTRCYYFYDTATPCNKREPGSGCAAIGGVNRVHAVLGTSDTASPPTPPTCAWPWPRWRRRCMCEGPAGERAIAFAEFHRLPGDAPRSDTTLEAGEIIRLVDLPAEDYGRTTPISSCATGSPTPSPWCRWRPR